MYIILITFSVFFIFLVAFIVANRTYDYDFLSAVSATISIISFIILFIMGICVASKDASAKVSIAKFEAIRTTIDEQRKGSGTELERVEMTKTIIENNTWLADQKASYYNPLDSWFCSDLYLQVEPLK